MSVAKINYKKACSTESFRRGFTLVELLVTISIFVILTGVVLFNQNKFNSTILLTNLAYDTALTIRQAQTYGINIKEFNTGAGTDASKFIPYGVHFETGANNKSFILFADLSYDATSETTGGTYVVPDVTNPVDVSTCQLGKGCVTRYSIKRGNYISGLCVNSDSTTDGDCTKASLDIVFQRPNPDAIIQANNTISDTKFFDATIIIQGADGSTRKVKVSKNGLIEIKYK